MKKVIALVVLFISTVLNAGQYQGQIINLLPDDEGMKIILKEKSNVLSLYLSKSSENFTQIYSLAESIKTKQTKAIVYTESNELGEVIKIVEGK